MTPLTAEDARLVALVAVFAPRRAGELAPLLATPDSGTFVGAASLAAEAPRAERLAALAAAHAGSSGARVRSEAVEALAAAERPPTATVVRALGAQNVHGVPGDGGLPALRRLLHERLAALAG